MWAALAQMISPATSLPLSKSGTIGRHHLAFSNQRISDVQSCGAFINGDFLHFHFR
jgi:hypothetical protein